MKAKRFNQGKAMLSFIELTEGMKQISGGRSIPSGTPPHVNITIRQRDINNINISYDLLSGGRSGDKTLSRALHRFLLGRNRSDLVDKLVDYVISWEALLLTQEGSAIKQELSYRFSMNGSSLINAVDKKQGKHELLKKLKVAYSTRSTLVHGGSDADMNKDLQKGTFNSLQELCDFLEMNFRNSLFWLYKLKPKDRPYKKHHGWEELIWKE